MVNSILLAIFIFGTIIGSFLNVVILRYQTGRLTGPRSACFHCNQTLSWYELIPIISFFILRRRCQHCHNLISWQYPLVEFMTGFILAILAWHILPLNQAINLEIITSFLFQAAIIAVLVVITVYDLKHKIIPDQLIIIASGLILGGQIVLNLFTQVIWWSGLGSILSAGVLVASPLLLLWAVSRGRWLGFGDVKLAATLGGWLGLIQGFSALAVAFWSGALISVGLILRQHRLKRLAGAGGGWQLSPASKKLTIKSEVPFAPFLVFGALISLFFQLDVFSLSPLLALLNS